MRDTLRSGQRWRLCEVAPNALSRARARATRGAEFRQHVRVARHVVADLAPKLVGTGLLAKDDCEELIADLSRARTSQNEFVLCPPVYELIARNE